MISVPETTLVGMRLARAAAEGGEAIAVKETARRPTSRVPLDARGREVGRPVRRDVGQFHRLVEFLRGVESLSRRSWPEAARVEGDGGWPGGTRQSDAPPPDGGRKRPPPGSRGRRRARTLAWALRRPHRLRVLVRLVSLAVRRDRRRRRSGSRDDAVGVEQKAEGRAERQDVVLGLELGLGETRSPAVTSGAPPRSRRAPAPAARGRALAAPVAGEGAGVNATRGAWTRIARRAECRPLVDAGRGATTRAASWRLCAVERARVDDLQVAVREHAV